MTIEVPSSDFQFLQRERVKSIDVPQFDSFVRAIRDYYSKKSIEDRKKRPLILTIDAGGTISMEHQNSKEVGGDALIAQSQNYETLIKSIVPPAVLRPYNEHNYKIANFPAFSLDSSDMKAEHVSDLVTLVSLFFQELQEVNGLEIAGVTVMMGTDKMSEVSTRFAMQMGQDIPFPIVFTGSQHPLSELGSDAEQNVANSIRTITMMNGTPSEENSFKGKKEVVICFGSGIHRAAGTEKLDAASPDGINSKLFKPLGEVRHGILHKLADWTRTSSGIFIPRPLYDDDKSLKVKVLPELDTEFDIRDIAGLIKDRVGAILVPTNASGAMSKEHFFQLQQFCEEHGKLLIISNQTAPLLEADYEMAQIARDTKGVLYLTMTRWAVQAKFKQLCALFENDLDRVAEAMKQDFIGEIPNEANKRRTPIVF